MRTTSALNRELAIAIQGELGSNSHLAATEMLGDVRLTPCRQSGDVFDVLDGGSVDGAILPIENSLHGSVADHYDLLLERGAEVHGEILLRIRHALIAAPGVRLVDLRRVISHPVALSQCRRWLAAHSEIEVVPAYDTAGSVKRIMQEGWLDTAGVAPTLAAAQYGAEVIANGIEDHADNFTRFYLLARAGTQTKFPKADANKISMAFSLEHRAGTLVRVLLRLSEAGLNLTKIESRPVISQPWEYVFYVDVRIDDPARGESALEAVRKECLWMKVLGRFRAAHV